MKKVKSLLKSNVKLFIGFIIGGTIFGGGIYAATLFNSDQVTYTGNSNSTVKGALDDLYSISKRYTNITYGIVLRGARGAYYSRAGIDINSVNSSSNMFARSVYNYFKLHDLTTTGGNQGNMADCYVEGYYVPTRESKRLTLNTKYTAVDYSSIELFCKSVDENAWSSAYVLVDFYN